MDKLPKKQQKQEMESFKKLCFAMKESLEDNEDLQKELKDKDPHLFFKAEMAKKIEWQLIA